MPPDVDGRARSYRGKRAFDIAVVIVLALPAAAVVAASAVAIKVTSPGPIFFRQERVGGHGRRFRVWKLRTMIHAADNPPIPDPSRIPPVGRWLRRLSVDELPQLINVARGEMSIVGPRPAPVYQVERYDDRQRGRLVARPGITGLAQIAGRNRLQWAERIEHDLDYIARQSLALDLKIVLRTIGAVLLGGGVEGHPLDDGIAMPSDRIGSDDNPSAPPQGTRVRRRGNGHRSYGEAAK